MTISRNDNPQAYALDFTEDEMIVRLKDGRTLHLPLVWYPSLEQATPAERSRFEIIGDGEGFHWPDLDEDLSVLGFLQGIRLDNTPHAA